MKKLFCLYLIIFTAPVFGEVLSDFTNICGVSGYGRMYAVPKSFTCQSGQFLPANAVQCYACPSGYTCDGGTYQFSSTKAQGLVKTGYTNADAAKACSSNLVMRRMYAVPKSFTCASGQFLPANAIQCYACPSGYTCNGGTYQFSSKNAQGIVKNENYTQFTTNEHYTCASNFNHVMNGSWTPNVITLNWDYKDGRISTSQCVYDTLITDIPANPTRPGYKFMGWRVKTDN